MNNNDMRELKLAEMEQVNGGVKRTVNTGNQQKAAVRIGPSKAEKQIASLENGTVVDTISDELFYDSVAERHFVQVTFIDNKGNKKIGWIASSLVGLPR